MLDYGVKVLTKGIRFGSAFENWPRVLLDHLGLARGTYVTKLRDGTTFNVRAQTDDRHVLFEIFAQGIYNVPINPGDTVIDIGANIGGFSVMAARRGARVFAFEPFPSNFAALASNVARNNLDVVIVQAAVSDADRMSEMFIPDNTSFSGRYSLHPGRGGRIINVPCVSLDSVVSQYNLPMIDLVKIDCQGSEYEILYGASADTLGRIRSMVIECEEFPQRPDWSTTALASFLEARGFTVSVNDHMVHAFRLESPLRSEHSTGTALA